VGQHADRVWEMVDGKVQEAEDSGEREAATFRRGR
jgi:hypothetical protein